jgi:transposase-like protein
MPRVVVTDGSNLYPAVLAALWPDADHQLCVVHVIKDINADFRGREEINHLTVVRASGR